MNKKTLAIFCILFLSGIVLYSSAYIYRNVYINNDLKKSNALIINSSHFQFSKEISDELKKIAAAHGQLDQMEIIYKCFEQNPKNLSEISEPDSSILYRMGDSIMLEQGEIIRVQTPKQSLLIVPEEKMLVLQDPDQSIYQIWKESATKYHPDSIAELYKGAAIKSISGGLKMISIWPDLDERVNQIDIYYSESSYLISKIVEHISEYDDAGDIISFFKITESIYKPIKGNIYSDFFDFNNYYKKDKKGKLKGVAELSSFDVYNSTKAELFKKLKK